MTTISKNKRSMLLGAFALGAFSVGSLLPVESFSANCGEQGGQGVVTCSGNDNAANMEPAPAPAPAPDPEPEGDCDGGCTD